MKKILSVLAVSLLAAGYAIGSVIEDRTHALHVSRITGAPYFQVLDPLHRDWSSVSETTSPDSDEVCSDSEPCESNQD
jgi:hypothetical protein